MISAKKVREQYASESEKTIRRIEEVLESLIILKAKAGGQCVTILTSSLYNEIWGKGPIPYSRSEIVAMVKGIAHEYGYDFSYRGDYTDMTLYWSEER